MSRDEAMKSCRCFSGRTSPHRARTCDRRQSAEVGALQAGRQRELCETIREQSRPIRSTLTGPKGSTVSPSIIRHNRLLQKLNFSRSHRPFGRLMANSTAFYELNGFTYSCLRGLSPVSLDELGIRTQPWSLPSIFGAPFLVSGLFPVGYLFHALSPQSK
jgi:hypothetical protein